MVSVRSRTWRLGLVVIGVVLVSAAFIPAVYRDPDTGTTVLSNPFRFVLTVGPGGIVVALGHRLERFDIEGDLYSRILAWSVAGAGAFLFITLLVTWMYAYSESAVVLDAFSLQVGAGVGAATGSVVGISEARTITREREAARERSAATAAAEQREKLRFLNNLLRHHVLNGLQIIQGNAEMLRVEHDPECADTIIERSDAIAELVRNVRTLVAADTIDPKREPIDLTALLRRELTAIEELHPDAVIEADIPEGLQVLAGRFLQAVFENLLCNAAEHNDATTPKMTVEAERLGEQVRVCIADNGPGIEDVTDAFEPGDSGTRGVGLHLVRRLITRYDGEISVESGDSGTIVEVALPAVPPESPEMATDLAD